MSETCTHDCASCGESCGERQQSAKDFLEKPHELTHIKKVIGVISGKGGVGKSLIASLLAVLMHQRGYETGILDADVTGPSIPQAFGVGGHAIGNEQGLLPMISRDGIEIMSLNLLLENTTDPVVWRGPVIAGVVKQFWTDVLWGDVDFLFVDMPPGTGDVPLTVFQSLPVDGVIVVTSPQELVGMIVEKAVNMAAMMHIPVLGIVENMSCFVCPDCGKRHSIFGESHLDEIAERHGIQTICRLPIDPAVAKATDAGDVEGLDPSALSDIGDVLAALIQ